jgi:hypothetical protein
VSNHLSPQEALELYDELLQRREQLSLDRNAPNRETSIWLVDNQLKALSPLLPNSDQNRAPNNDDLVEAEMEYRRQSEPIRTATVDPPRATYQPRPWDLPLALVAGAALAAGLLTLGRAPSATPEPAQTPVPASTPAPKPAAQAPVRPPAPAPTAAPALAPAAAPPVPALPVAPPVPAVPSVGPGSFGYAPPVPAPPQVGAPLAPGPGDLGTPDPVCSLSRSDFLGPRPA